MTPTVRPEQPADTVGIDAVLRAAFPTDVEARLVSAFRAAGHLPVSLVADLGGWVVGQIGFSPVAAARGWGVTGANGPHRRYTVGITGSARVAYLDVVRRAEESGAGDAVVEAYRDILSRLGREICGSSANRCTTSVGCGWKSATPQSAPSPSNPASPTSNRWVVIRRVRWLADPAG
jgi:hypothetical protein